MRQGIELKLSDKGQPVAHVPCGAAWDLVEYLANQRVHVVYSFEESRVAVRFDHLSLEAATNLLERWSRVDTRDDRYYPERVVPRAAAVHA